MMKREIKFDYLVKRHNGFVFHRVFELHEIEMGGVAVWVNANHVHESDLFRRQFTGIHDRNGKEIYEGDIIKLAKGTMRSIFTVPGGFAFECLDGDVGKYGKIQCCPFEPMGDEQNVGYIQTQAEIIGNIYEHPHLISELPGR